MTESYWKNQLKAERLTAKNLAIVEMTGYYEVVNLCGPNKIVKLKHA